MVCVPWRVWVQGWHSALESHTKSILVCTVVQVDADTPVAIYAEGKEHAMAIGYTKMSTADMRSINKGIGVSPLALSCA